jgi:hypothetical protein
MKVRGAERVYGVSRGQAAQLLMHAGPIGIRTKAAGRCPR